MNEVGGAPARLCACSKLDGRAARAMSLVWNIIRNLAASLAAKNKAGDQLARSTTREDCKAISGVDAERDDADAQLAAPSLANSTAAVECGAPIRKLLNVDLDLISVHECDSEIRDHATVELVSPAFLHRLHDRIGRNTIVQSRRVCPSEFPTSGISTSITDGTSDMST